MFDFLLAEVARKNSIRRPFPCSSTLLRKICANHVVSVMALVSSWLLFMSVLRCGGGGRVFVSSR